MAKKEKLSLDELLEQALVNDEEKPFLVPSNWVWTRLKSITLPMLTTKPDKNKKYFRYIDIDAIENKTQRIREYKTIETVKSPSRAIRGLEEGNTLFSMVRPYLRNIAYVNKEYTDCIASSGFFVCKPFKTINSRYLFYLLCSEYVISNLTLLMKGDNSPSIRSSELEEFPIPLPPQLEQQRIVDLIESLFDKLDRAKELVQNVVDSFENRKSAIFHKAFTGDLTAKWRAVNQLTPVKSILKDVEEERFNLQKKHSVNKSFSYKESAKIELQGRTKGIDKLFKLPNTWDWVSLGQVTWNVSDGPHFSPNYVDKENGVPIISARNIKYKNIDFDDVKYVSNEDCQEFIKRGKPEIGDVLLTKGGTTGIPTTVDTEREFCIWVHIALLKIIREYASPEYIRDVLASFILYRQSQEQTHGVGNQDLGLTRMIYMALPLPPLAEQKEIVRILNNLLKNEQKAKELYKIIGNIDLMKKSILDRAFRGELSTNNPNEESASELLKEVLREKT